MKTMENYLRLTRPLNDGLTFVSAWVGSWVGITTGIITLPVITGGLGAALIAAGGYVINDYFDVGIDKVNRPDRPLAAGRVGLKAALVFSVILFGAGLGLSLAVSLHCSLISCLAIALLVVYSAWLKKTVLLGNLVVSFIAGLTFIFGGVIVNNPRAALVPAVFAFLFHLGREVVKDLEDMEGDRQAGAKTLALVGGETVSRLLVTIVFIGLIGFTTVPFLLDIYGLYYLYTVVFGVDIILLSLIFLIWDKKDYRKASRILKFDMIAGLVAIILGKF